MITDHLLWPTLRPHVRIERYDRDGGHTHPRFRLEVQPRGMAGPVLRALLQMEVPCAACGLPIHPVRNRARGVRPLHLFLAVTCPLSVNLACARSRKAADAYTHIISVLTVANAY